MALYSLILYKDDREEAVERLGELGLLHFIDSNKNTVAYQLAYNKDVIALNDYATLIK